MDCPKCAAELDEQARFCTACGYKLEKQAGELPAGLPVAEEKGEKVASPTPVSERKVGTTVLGLVMGTIVIVIGLVRVLTAGTSITATSFGGDFYTYTYQGIVAISELLASVEVSLGWIIVAIGVGIDVSCLRKR